MRRCAKLNGRVSGVAFSKHCRRAPMPLLSQKKHTFLSRNNGISGSCQWEKGKYLYTIEYSWSKSTRIHISPNTLSSTLELCSVNIRFPVYANYFYDTSVIFSKHLLRYWPIFARSSTLHYAGAVNTRQNMAVHINNLVPSEFPNRSSRSAMSLISTLICI